MRRSAIGQSMLLFSFAPGSEILKDKRVHTCCGFADWEYQGKRSIPIDPFGPPIEIMRCASCGGAEDCVLGTPVTDCPICCTARSQIELREPRGFRTTYAPIDFDDQAERGPLLPPPQLATLNLPQGVRTIGDLTSSQTRKLRSWWSMTTAVVNFRCTARATVRWWSPILRSTQRRVKFHK